ncbi:MAG: L-rhamnose isomerase [Chloroflexota bacterium]
MATVTNDYLSAYPAFAERLTKRGIDLEAVKTSLKNQHIETPSWGYGNSGTRFKVFPWAGAARNIHERVSDAAYVNKLTGVAPSVAIHIPWDKTDDWTELGQEARALGIEIGAVNPNLFQDNAYKLGSVCNPSPAIREEAVAHMIECCEIMRATGSKLFSLWLADGTNYAGQDSIVERKHRLEDSLRIVYGQLPPDSRMLIEYKFFEPTFYTTDLPDWGTAYAVSLKLGTQAQVLVDTGHHPQGTNIPMIIAFLLDEGRLGGFHFNARQYADDDLIVGTTNPLELFLIYHELVSAGEKARDVAYMIDQNFNIESKLEGMLLSVVNCQTAYAKSLIVDRAKLRDAQRNGDVLGGHRILMEAFESDVRPILAQVRQEMGLHPDPIEAFRADDYQQRVAESRGIAGGSLGGFPG